MSTTFTIRVVDGPGCRECVHFAHTLSIGRDKQNDLVLPAETVSRFHAVLIGNNGSCVLRDYSLNGVLVNFSSVCKTAIVNPGSLISIENYVLRFDFLNTADPATDTKPIKCWQR